MLDRVFENARYTGAYIRQTTRAIAFKFEPQTDQYFLLLTKKGDWNRYANKKARYPMKIEQIFALPSILFTKLRKTTLIKHNMFTPLYEVPWDVVHCKKSDA